MPLLRKRARGTFAERQRLDRQARIRTVRSQARRGTNEHDIIRFLPIEVAIHGDDDALIPSQALRATGVVCAVSVARVGADAPTIRREPRCPVRNVHAHCSMTPSRRPGLARN